MFRNKADLENRNRQKVDGIPDYRRSGNYSAAWLPPVNAIERIEVLKGAGSALYGTDAVGGVINIITKKGSELESHVTVRAASGSWNTEQYGITAGGATENVREFKTHFGRL